MTYDNQKLGFDASFTELKLSVSNVRVIEQRLIELLAYYGDVLAETRNERCRRHRRLSEAKEEGVDAWRKECILVTGDRYEEAVIYGFGAPLEHFSRTFAEHLLARVRVQEKNKGERSLRGRPLSPSAYRPSVTRVPCWYPYILAMQLNRLILQINDILTDPLPADLNAFAGPTRFCSSNAEAEQARPSLQPLGPVSQFAARVLFAISGQRDLLESNGISLAALSAKLGMRPTQEDNAQILDALQELKPLVLPLSGLRFIKTEGVDLLLRSD